MTAGRTVGHYQLLAHLGAGGMGVVWRAHDTALHRDVALKFLPKDALLDPAARQRLLDEARIASSLNHPHICTIHEIAEEAGELYVAMELIEGQPLYERIPREGMPAETVARYGAQIADALDHAHSRGVVHRDLKPSNVLVTPEGRAKVLDFGLAIRTSDPAADVTRSSRQNDTRLAGTLAYMAPETLRGEGSDARSDIFALGVMLYQMAAGVPPFRGSTVFELSSAILRDAPAPLPGSTPPSLRAVILRCLAKEPAQRYARAAEVRAALEAVAMGESSAAIEAPRVAAGRLRRRAVWWAAGALLALLVIALLLDLGGIRSRFFPGGAAGVRSLAVLPLENLSGDAEQTWFAAGMSEALSTELARLPGVDIVSLRGLRDTSRPAEELARELRLDAFVRGSVLRAGDRVRVSVQLVEARNSRTLWAETFDRSMGDVLSTHSEVALAVAREIQLALAPRQAERLARTAQVQPAAYEAYLRGRHHWNRRTRDDLLRALEYFNEAVAADPDYAPAYVGLADTYNVLVSSADLPPAEWLPRARAAAERALELDPALGEAWVPLASIHTNYGEWRQAEEAFQQAIRLSPSSATAHHWYALFLASQGRHAAATEMLARARTLEPLSLIIQANHAWLAYLAGDYDGAVAAARRTLELEPGFAVAQGYLGQALLEQGRHADAIAALERAWELSGRAPSYLAELANALGVAGQRERARALVGQLEVEAGQRAVSSYALALAYAGLGQSDKVVEKLMESYRRREARWVNAAVHPRFAPFRSDPRFAALLAEMGLSR